MAGGDKLLARLEVAVIDRRHMGMSIEA